MPAYKQAEGIGFAIPSVVRSVYHQLRQKGRVSRGTIGLFVQDISPPMAKGLGLPVQLGVVAADVERDGAAYRAGLKRADVILTLNAKAIETARQFEDAIYRRQAGEKITLIVQRGDTRLALTSEVKAVRSVRPTCSARLAGKEPGAPVGHSVHRD